jgi:initiation factor 1A
MVKNAFGGSKSKSLARKHESSSTSHFIRMIQDPSEKFAIVQKIFGGSICQVFCDDLITRQAIIRGKFRGKGKRHNIISSGTLVLVGLRDFSHSLVCDIIEVYSPNDFISISQKPSFPSSILSFHFNLHNHNPHNPHNHNPDNNNLFLFDNSEQLPTHTSTLSHTDTSLSNHTDSFDFSDI